MAATLGPKKTHFLQTKAEKKEDIVGIEYIFGCLKDSTDKVKHPNKY